jgi:hypothetical protein
MNVFHFVTHRKIVKANSIANIPPPVVTQPTDSIKMKALFFFEQLEKVTRAVKICLTFVSAKFK